MVGKHGRSGGARPGAGRKKTRVVLDFSYHPEVIEQMEFLRKWYGGTFHESAISLLVEDKYREVKAKAERTGCTTLHDYLNQTREG